MKMARVARPSKDYRASSASARCSPALAGGSYLRRRIALAGLFAREERRATDLERSTLRRASLTASDVGKAAATSGLRATSVVPFSRPAYLPRTPGPSAAKSYSGRRSSAILRLAFFIGAAL